MLQRAVCKVSECVWASASQAAVSVQDRVLGVSAVLDLMAASSCYPRLASFTQCGTGGTCAAVSGVCPEI